MLQAVAFTRTLFWSIGSQWLRDLGPPSVLDYLPPKKGPFFKIFLNSTFL